jgi:hypothetical protein
MSLGPEQNQSAKSGPGTLKSIYYVCMFRVGSNIMHNLLDIPLACFRRSTTAWEGFVVLSNRIASKSRFNRIGVKIKPSYNIRDRNAAFARSDNRSSFCRL